MAAEHPAPAVTMPTMLALFAAPRIFITSDGQQEPIAPLAIEREFDAIEVCCKRTGLAIQIQIEIANAHRLGELCATTTTPYALLHFSGHGSGHASDAALLLEERYAPMRGRLLPRTELAALLGDRPLAQLAFLSACHSEALADALLASGTRHVVAIRFDDAVLDIAAREFAERFYPALLAGNTVRQAFERARQAVLSSDTLRQIMDSETLQSANLSEDDKFCLLPADDPIHDQPLFISPQRGEVLVARRPWERTNLPETANDPFVARESELHTITSTLLEGQRCVAISGFGGMGKTALATNAARQLHIRAAFADGSYIVPLRGIAQAAAARTRIAETLALAGLLPSEQLATLVQSDGQLAMALQRKHVLLLLDDLDNLLQHDPGGVIALLSALLGNRTTHVLTTSRPGLPGQLTHRAIPLLRLNLQDAIRVFLKYLIPYQPHASEFPDLITVLGRLDGYIFPIRLAALYRNEHSVSIAELWRRLQQQWPTVLQYSDMRGDDRASLEATLQLSFTALPQPLRVLFTQAALFPAGLRAEAAELIISAGSGEHLHALRQAGMMELSEGPNGVIYTLPEPARYFALLRLRVGAFGALADRALAYYAAWLIAQNQRFTQKTADNDTTDNLTIRLTIAAERANWERLLDWGYVHEHGMGSSLSAQATSALGNYWTLAGERGKPALLNRLTRARAAAIRLEDRAGEANVLQAIGDVEQFRGDRDAALASYAHALTLFRAMGDRLGEANVLQAIGDVQQFRKQSDAALASYAHALTLFRAMGERVGEANVLRAIGDVEQFRGDRDAALASYAQALTLFRAIGDRLGEANVLAALSRLVMDSDPAESQRLLEQALASRRAIGDRYSEGADLGNYGIALLQRSRNDEALDYLQRARDLFATVGITEMLPQTDALIAQASGTAPEQRGPDMAQVLSQFDPLLRAIAAVALGDGAGRAEIEPILAQLETQGWRLSGPAQQIWQGERDVSALCADIDGNSAMLVQRVLAYIADPETMQTESPEE